jgi:putative transposase
MYFVTMCTKDREHFFGEIEHGAMNLSNEGEIASVCWIEIPRHFLNVALDEFVIMPDHMHGILILKEINPVGAQYIEPPRESANVQSRRVRLNQFQKVAPGSISSIIRSYKAAVSRLCGQAGFQQFRWQRN